MILGTIELQPERDNVTAARAFVARLARRHVGCDPVWCDDALLAVSELVTNAVVHARTAFQVEVRLVADAVRVTVSDGDDRTPARRPLTLDATNGRGMHLVDAVTHRWGVERRSRGKAVWFELPLPSPTTSPARSIVRTTPNG